MAMTMSGTAAVGEDVGNFGAFFVANHERLLRAIYLVTGDRHEAEDLTQETFVKAYERWGRIGGLENPDGAQRLPQPPDARRRQPTRRALRARGQGPVGKTRWLRADAGRSVGAGLPHGRASDDF